MLLTRYRAPSGGGAFVPFSTTYTTPGTQTVSVPSGATSVVIEGYGGGAGGDSNLDLAGGGGAYSKTTLASLTGVTALYLSVPAASIGDAGTTGGDAFVKQNTSSGTTLMLAKGGGTDGTRYHGGAATSGTGDTKFSGGNGSQGNGAESGGGAAGPNGNGGNAAADGSAPGTGNGGLAGDGADWTAGVDGGNYGGGGATRTLGTSGAQGAIVLSWS
jgi:hypothetical protein